MAVQLGRAVLVFAVLVLFSGFIFAISASDAANVNSKNPKLLGDTSLFVDPSGNGLITLSNHSKQPLTVQSIAVNGAVLSFNEVLLKKETKQFYLTGITDVCSKKNFHDGKKAEVVVGFVIGNETGVVKEKNIQVSCLKRLPIKNPSNIVGLGVGTMANPWVINSCSELSAMNSLLDGNYALGANIDCSMTKGWNGGAGFLPIGTSIAPFTGVLDGKGYDINGLYIYRPDLADVGLIGYGVGFSESVASPLKNLVLSDFNVTGGGNVGGFFGTLGDGYIDGLFIAGSFADIRGENRGYIAGFNNGLANDNGGYGTIGTVLINGSCYQNSSNTCLSPFQ